jgi:hypothetical protein
LAVTEGYRDRETDRCVYIDRKGDLISLLLFFQNEENRLKTGNRVRQKDEMILIFIF